MSKNAGNLYFNTSFRNGGRKAGYGMYEDDYSEESDAYGAGKPRGLVRFPNDDIDPEELNGECIIIKKGERKD